MNEYPKEPGWYWFRDYPFSQWRPQEVTYKPTKTNMVLAFFKFNVRLDLDFTWPQQWGPKIEEPKS